MQSSTFIIVFSAKYWTGHQYFIHNWSNIARSLVKIKSIPDWHLFITQIETKWTKWYAMTSHVIAYRLLELLFGTHTFHFNCFFEDFHCVFTQIRCLSRVLNTVMGFHVSNNPSLVLVQPRKIHPFMTERLLMGRKESNQTNKQFMGQMKTITFLQDDVFY